MTVLLCDRAAYSLLHAKGGFTCEADVILLPDQEECPSCVNSAVVCFPDSSEVEFVFSGWLVGAKSFRLLLFSPVALEFVLVDVVVVVVAVDVVAKTPKVIKTGLFIIGGLTLMDIPHQKPRAS